MQSKNLVAVSLALGLTAGMSAAANAQTATASAQTTVPTTSTGGSALGKSPLRLKFGGFIPGTGGTRHAIKDLFLGGGLTYDLAKTAPDSAIISGYLDVTGSDNGDAPLASRIFVLGLGPQMRYNINGNFASRKFYLGTGAGAYLIKAEREYIRNFRLFTRDDTFYKFGAKLFGGVEFRSGWLAELSYTSVGTTNDLNGSGLNLSVGLRL